MTEILDMRLDILRAATLCMYGREFMAAGQGASAVEVQSKSSFKGVTDLEFRKVSSHHLSAGAALGSKQWMMRLRAEGIDGMRLHLPLSLVQPPKEAWGIVTDGPAGCDIWTPKVVSGSSPSIRVDFNASRFVAWSLRSPMSDADVRKGLVETWKRVLGSLPDSGSTMAQIAKTQIRLIDEKSTIVGDFWDLIPPSVEPATKELCSAAVRVVTTLTAPGFNPSSHPSQLGAFESLWLLSMRGLETAAHSVATQVALP